MNKTTRNNEITEEMMKDSRLFPLFCDTTKLLFQLFVLEIKNNDTNEKIYKIVYGLCIRTTREDVSDEYFCSDFNKVYTSINNTYSISKISIYNYPSIIIDLVNELLLGKSLKNASDKLNANKLKFDVFYAKNFSIRPVIFNETNTFISRNPYEKNALISPFKDIPSFTLIIYNLDKMNVLFIDEKIKNSALLSVLKYLQEETNLPFLTTGCVRFGNIEFINTQCADKVAALDLGADDYLTKPFGTDELLARVRTAIRHTRTISGNDEIARNGTYTVGELVIDYNKHQVRVRGENVHLTLSEFRIVALLGKYAGKVLTYDFIIKELWGPRASGDNQILRVNMANIRRKIEKNPAEPEYLFTEMGVGYRMAEGS